jgi:outer membrane protein assembly factor BamE (lipoprotein component of BamABCDE complex)
MRRRFLLAGLAALAITGCTARSGNEFHADKAEQLVPGRTTLTEARQIIGQPTGYGATGEGGKVVVWQYTHATVMPIVPFVNGGHGNTLAIQFDKNDVMVRIVSQHGVTSGIIDQK